jgi:hypothetical protein
MSNLFLATLDEKLDEWNCRPCVDRHYELVYADETHSEDIDESTGRRLCGCSDYHDNVCTLTYADL